MDFASVLEAGGSLALSIGVFAFAVWLNRKTNSPLLNPLLVTVVDPVNPNPDGGVVKPGSKDPGKGENVFGQVIKFNVAVTNWATPRIGDIDMSAK